MLKFYVMDYFFWHRDFDYFKMDSIEGIRYVGGFARAGNITPEDFYKAKPDPLCSFAEPIMKHMNEDHADANQAMVEHSIGIPCRDAKMIGLDQLGMTVSRAVIAAGSILSRYRSAFPCSFTQLFRLSTIPRK